MDGGGGTPWAGDPYHRPCAPMRLDTDYPLRRRKYHCIAGNSTAQEAHRWKSMVPARDESVLPLYQSCFRYRSDDANSFLQL
jgi:hypothetical protein